MLSGILLGTLFAGVCAATLVRPLGLGGGWWAGGGAAIALMTGLVPLSSALSGVGGTWEVLLFFAGLVLLTVALAQAGAMEWLLDLVEQWSGTSPRRLMVGSLVVTAAVTTLFSNDAAALLVAPVVARRAARRGLPSARFVVGIAVMANAASLILPVSNPVNLLVLERDHIPLSSYLLQVTPAALLAVLVAGLALSWLLTRRLPARSSSLAVPGSERDVGKLVALGALLGVLLAVDLWVGGRGLSLGPPTFAGGVLAVMIGWTRGGVSPLRAVRAGRWSLLPLVAGLAVLGAGLESAGPLAALAHQLVGTGGVGGQVRVGLATAGASAIANNLPAAFLGMAGLGAVGQLRRLGIPLIAGADLGANLAPTGSLSTLIILAPGGGAACVRSRHFWAAGWFAGPLGLAAALSIVALAR
ncbi:MAG: ArsB/NhaD family transporter [Candidatus Dormibacteraeota bacterium]|nr:ArsB/NhaD family transporter [Candidatus Dormibacteraeota bacterium]